MAILGVEMAEGLEITQQRWLSWPGSHPRGREGSGLMCCIPLSLALILPHCKNQSGEVTRDSG